ncbi:MAG: 3-phosphoshikimate 1-carboxyvinyltransferase [Anaerolineae bacterium]
MNLRVKRGTSLQGEIDLPGDKSITHRALLLGSLGSGTSRISNYLDGADCRATVGCIRSLGVAINRRQTELLVQGRGLRGWREPSDVLDCIRSGTTMRLLSGLLAGQPFMSILNGRTQLRARPMDRIISPLRLMGARISGRSGDRLPPLCISGTALQGIEYRSPVASAQVSSCVLLAGLFAEGTTTVIEPARSRDHTARMLRARGVAVLDEGSGQSLQGPILELAGMDVNVPGDISSAAYFLVASLLVPGSELLLRAVGINPSRTGILDVLSAMGATIDIVNEHDEGGEPVSDLFVRQQELDATTISGALIPRLIDEIPILALAATQAKGVTTIRDASELRVKETDRIATIVKALRALGAQVEPRNDGLVVEGPTPLHGALVECAGDHRIAMMAVIAGLIASGETVVTDIERVQDSFPGFEHMLAGVAPGAIQ